MLTGDDSADLAQLLHAIQCDLFAKRADLEADGETTNARWVEALIMRVGLAEEMAGELPDAFDCALEAAARVAPVVVDIRRGRKSRKRGAS